MKIITCASYCATGSSAITDLFAEFDNCANSSNFEFRFIHDPNGVRDLEYNLIENNNRHNTSHAIKRYLTYAKFINGSIFRTGYKDFMGESFMKYTNEYINNITELKCEAWWHYDNIERGRVFHTINSLIDKLTAAFFKERRGTNLFKLFHESAYFSTISRDLFYKYTKEYIEKVVNSLNKDQLEYIMVDQLLPPSNISEYLNYFNDIKIIVSERDPRDIYLHEKYEYCSGVIPAKSVNDFCEWYKITRKHRKTELYDKQRVYLVQFEDLIYKYDETVSKIFDFVGINPQHHIAPKSHFIPTVSIKNTNLKKKYSKYKEEIQYIEENLKEYIYNFSEYDEI